MNIFKRTLCLMVLNLTSGGSLLAAGLDEAEVCPPAHLPLVASIPISDFQGLSAANVDVALASREDMTLAGIAYPDTLKSLRINDDFSIPGAPVIRISACNPGDHLSLRFLIDFRWPSGRLLKEYNIALGVVTDGNFEDGEEPADVTLQELSSAAQVIEIQPPLHQDTTYRVSPGDTLWSIAKTMQHGLPIDTLVVEIVRMNPAAFINGKPDLLRADAILRLP
jgi:pilus assembly protein FimV